MAATKTATPPPTPVLCGYANSAVELGISRNGIYRLVESGELQCVRVLGRPMITRASLDAYLARLVSESA